MRQVLPISLSPSFDESRAPAQSRAQLVNCYAEASSGKGRFAILPYPKCSAVTNFTRGAVRGLYADQRPGGKLFAVAGPDLFVHNGGGAFQFLGDVPGVDLAEFAANAHQVGLIADGRLWVYDTEDGSYRGPTEISGDPVPAFGSFAALNGVGVLSVAGTDRWYYTGVNDFRSLRQLDSAIAERSPDPIVAVRVVHDELCFLGAATLEFYVNDAANPNFPYSRRGVKSDVGCVSRDSAQLFDNSLVFLGRAREGGLGVYRLQGYDPVKISPHAVDRLLERSQASQNARAVTWGIDGHKFYTLTTDAGSVTYDAATGAWHRTASGLWPHGAEPPPSVWTAQCWKDGVNYFGDEEGRVLVMGFGESGIGVPPTAQEIWTPPFGQLGRRMAVYALDLECETGQGSLTEPAEVQMVYSVDGGHVWSEPRAATLGLQGQYGGRARWSRLGAGREYQARFRASDGAQMRVTGAWAEIEPRFRA